MGYYDLNLPTKNIKSSQSISENDKASHRTRMVTKLLELGYSGVAYNHTIKGPVRDCDVCNITPLPLHSLVEASPVLQKSIQFHKEALGVGVKEPFKQFTRATLVLQTMVQASAVKRSGPVLSSYDLVAVHPTEQVIFEHACKNLEVDIISINFGERVPFPIRKTTVKAAIERGIFFEIMYSPAISNSGARKEMFATVKLLLDCTHGRSVVITSGASTIKELRGPYDAANLSSLFGLSMEHGKSAISKNCRLAVLHGLSQKGCHKSGISIENISESKDGRKEETVRGSDLWDPFSSWDGDMVINADMFENLQKNINKKKPSEAKKKKGSSKALSVNECQPALLQNKKRMLPPTADSKSVAASKLNKDLNTRKQPRFSSEAVVFEHQETNRGLSNKTHLEFPKWTMGSENASLGKDFLSLGNSKSPKPLFADASSQSIPTFGNPFSSLQQNQKSFSSEIFSNLDKSGKPVSHKELDFFSLEREKLQGPSVSQHGIVEDTQMEDLATAKNANETKGSIANENRTGDIVGEDMDMGEKASRKDAMMEINVATQVQSGSKSSLFQEEAKLSNICESADKKELDCREDVINKGNLDANWEHRSDSFISEERITNIIESGVSEPADRKDTDCIKDFRNESNMDVDGKHISDSSISEEKSTNRSLSDICEFSDEKQKDCGRETLNDANLSEGCEHKSESSVFAEDSTNKFEFDICEYKDRKDTDCGKDVTNEPVLVADCEQKPEFSTFEENITNKSVICKDIEVEELENAKGALNEANLHLEVENKSEYSDIVKKNTERSAISEDKNVENLSTKKETTEDANLTSKYEKQSVSSSFVDGTIGSSSGKDTELASSENVANKSNMVASQDDFMETWENRFTIGEGDVSIVKKSTDGTDVAIVDENKLDSSSVVEKSIEAFDSADERESVPRINVVNEADLTVDCEIKCESSHFAKKNKDKPSDDEHKDKEAFASVRDVENEANLEAGNEDKTETLPAVEIFASLDSIEESNDTEVRKPLEAEEAIVHSFHVEPLVIPSVEESKQGLPQKHTFQTSSDIQEESKQQECELSVMPISETIFLNIPGDHSPATEKTDVLDDKDSSVDPCRNHTKAKGKRSHSAFSGVKQKPKRKRRKNNYFPSFKGLIKSVFFKIPGP